MYPYGRSYRGTLVPVAGERTSQDLLSGRKNRYLLLLVKATMTVSGTLTSILNNGSVLALFDEFALTESGKDVSVADPRLIGFYSEWLRQSAGTQTRLTSTANGVTLLRELVMMPFELPFAALPRETQYLDLQVNQRFQFAARLNASGSGVGRIANGGTAAITAVSIEVMQYFDDLEHQLPVFKPVLYQSQHAVAAAGSQIEIPLQLGGAWLRGITIAQDTRTTGLVTDIINKVGLRGDRRMLIGEAGGLEPWDILSRSMEFTSGGNVYANPAGQIVHINFQEGGRLTKILSPADDTNLRLLLDAQPSVAGAGGSQLLIMQHRLTRDLALGDDGRMVVNPNFAIAA